MLPRFDEKRIVIGVDEAGRGALAGPVTVGMVFMRPGDYTGFLYDADDSKRIPEYKRERILRLLMLTFPISFGYATAQEIDALGIMKALRLAAGRAYDNLIDDDPLPREDALVVVDGNQDLVPHIGQVRVVGGDHKYLEIACASIVAKVLRDAEMLKMAMRFERYGFAQHKGYGTEKHMEKIISLGACEIHRKTFSIQDQGMGYRRKIGEFK